MARYVTPHGYGTKRIGFRCLDVTCEVERRGLSYQLVMLLEELPVGLIDMNFNSSVKQLKRALLNSQQREGMDGELLLSLLFYLLFKFLTCILLLLIEHFLFLIFFFVVLNIFSCVNFFYLIYHFLILYYL